MGQRILAVEVSGDCVHAALADRTYKSFELVAVYEQERTAGETDLSSALNRMVSAAGRCDVVISSLPGEFVAKRLLALPFTDRRRLQQVVAFALEEHLPFAVDDAVVAFARVLLNTKLWNPISLINDNKTVSGVDMSRLLHRPDLLRPQFESLLEMYQRGEIKPYVDHTFPFDEAAAAHRYLHDRKAVGKILLIP